MSEWISVKERLPEDRGGRDWKQCLVALNYGHRPTEWREAIWEHGKFRSPIPSQYTGCREPFRNVTHWREVDDLPPPPEPKMTVKEALREAIAALQEAWGISLAMQSEKGDFGRLIDLADEMYEMKFKELLPRLHSALESEE